jgi:hypothetical protein
LSQGNRRPSRAGGGHQRRLLDYPTNEELTIAQHMLALIKA